MKQIILMADIIGSREKNSVELISSFKEIVATANQRFKQNIKSPLTITLGDEFQGVLRDETSALEVVLLLEEERIHRRLDFKLRYVINQGKIDTLINTERAFEMMGQGLTEAREKLESLKKRDYRVSVTLSNKTLSDILNASFIILQRIIDSWKLESDYNVVSYFLTFKDYKAVAEHMKKNRSLLWKREKSLNIDSYTATKNIILTVVKLYNELS